MNQVQMRQYSSKVAIGMRIADAIRSLFNARGLQLGIVLGSCMSHC